MQILMDNLINKEIKKVSSIDYLFLTNSAYDLRIVKTNLKRNLTIYDVIANCLKENKDITFYKVEYDDSNDIFFYMENTENFIEPSFYTQSIPSIVVDFELLKEKTAFKENSFNLFQIANASREYSLDVKNKLDKIINNFNSKTIDYRETKLQSITIKEELNHATKKIEKLLKFHVCRERETSFKSEYKSLFSTYIFNYDTKQFIREEVSASSLDKYTEKPYYKNNELIPIFYSIFDKVFEIAEFLPAKESFCCGIDITDKFRYRLNFSVYEESIFSENEASLIYDKNRLIYRAEYDSVVYDFKNNEKVIKIKSTDYDFNKCVNSYESLQNLFESIYVEEQDIPKCLYPFLQKYKKTEYIPKKENKIINPSKNNEAVSEEIIKTKKTFLQKLNDFFSG